MSRDREKEQISTAKQKTPQSSASGREARLAEALRANLRRRKAQAQSRQQSRKSDADPAQS